MYVSQLFFFHPPGNFQLGTWSTPMFNVSLKMPCTWNVYCSWKSFFPDKWTLLSDLERVPKLKNPGIFIRPQTCIWAYLYEQEGYCWFQGHQLSWSTSLEMTFTYTTLYTVPSRLCKNTILVGSVFCIGCKPMWPQFPAMKPKHHGGQNLPLEKCCIT